MINILKTPHFNVEGLLKRIKLGHKNEPCFFKFPREKIFESNNYSEKYP